MAPHIDVFKGDAFGMVELTSLLLDQPHIPRRLGRLGIFDVEGVRTTRISIERQENTLALIPTTPRGGPAHQNKKDDRHLIDVATVTLKIEDTISAEEVQNVRELGSEANMETLQNEVIRRATRMSNSLEATLEHLRIGAIKGQVLDADGSTVLVDLFTTFGVAAQTEVNFELDASSPDPGALRKVCSTVIRLIEDALDGLPYDGIHAMCSSQFFDDLIAHPEVRDLYLATNRAQELRDRAARGQAFEYGGITFEEYRGTIGGTKYVADNKAHIFPVGVPELFLERYAPAPWWDTVNTRGLPRYMRMAMEDKFDESATWRVQSHPIMLCTRPNTLVPARRT